MKKFILALLLLPLFVYSQNGYSGRTAAQYVQNIFDRTVALDSIGYNPTLAALSMTTASNTVTANTTSSNTFVSDVFALDADSIGFVVEMLEVSYLSGGTNRISRTYSSTTPDSIGMAIKIQPLSAGGLGAQVASFNNTIAAAGDWRFGYIRVDTLRSNAIFGVTATRAERVTFVDNIKTAAFPFAATQGRLVILVQNWKAVDRTRFRLVVKIVKKWSGV